MSSGRRKDGRKRVGFTLVELLVVIAIMAVLLSILLPALHKAREQAKRAICLVHCRSMSMALTMYADDENNFYPMRGHYRYKIQLPGVVPKDDREAEAMLTGLGSLYPRYIDEPEIFYCPSQKWLTYNYEAGWEQNFPMRRGDPENVWGINSAYDYLYTIDPGEMPKRSCEKVKGKAVLADIFSMGAGSLGHIDAYSIGYFDGSARLYMDPTQEVVKTTTGFGSSAQICFDWWEVFSDYYNGL